LRVLDGRTLVLPDRRGNKRTDTLHNLLADDRLSIVALVPGRLEVVRLSGRAVLSDDPDLLRTMAVGAQIPHAAVVITVAAATVEASAAVETSQLWDRTRHVDLNAVPDLNALAALHLASNMSQGLSGRLLRFVARQLSRFPRLTRPLTAAMFSRQLRLEGYQENPPRKPGQPVRVTEVVQETAEATTLVLERTADGAAFDFLPGQFFTLVFEIGGRTVRRAYSASSAPGSTRLTVTVKRTTEGYASAHVRDHIRPGAELRILGPSGLFCVDRPPAELVLLAAGSGITPMMSIIRSTLAGPAGTRITLLYGNRTEADIIFAAALADLARAHPDRLTVHHVLSRPAPNWPGRAGRLDRETVRSLLIELAPGDDAHFYSCGPAGMLAGVAEVLDDLGVPAGRRFEEKFGSLAAAGDAAEQKMTVGDLGTVTVAAGQTLLDAGLEAALPMPYSCTVGSCGECRVRLRSGEVTMAEPNCLSPADRARGVILTCVTQPLTEVTVDIE
ncbi:MAG: 2Fe-2S iron-sulfur cluster-binding protein, partial [Actinoplanes sp.]